jgi:NADH:ubiquinone oxidoreductase subunit 6 (subunit J)
MVWMIPAAVLVTAISTRAFAAEPAADYHGVTSTAPAGSFLEAMMFYVVAGGTVLSALGVCISKNIVRMAVWLFVTLGSIALMYFLLAANFLGAIQLIVYAGGTLVLLIFGVMLTSKSPWVKFEPGKGELLLAGAVCITLFSVLVIVLSRATWHGIEQVVPGAPLEYWGRELLTRYLVPFEVAGVLLMIVMVGAAHLARQED